MKKTVVQRLSWVLALCLLLSLLAGCSGNSTAPADAGSSDDTPGSTGKTASEYLITNYDDTERISQLMQLTEPQLDEIHIGIPGDKGSFSPFAGSTTAYGMFNIIVQLYEKALWEDQSSGKVYGTVIKDYGQIDEEHVYVELYDYVHDTKGNPYSIHDFVFSIQNTWDHGAYGWTTILDPDRCEIINDYKAIWTLPDGHKLIDGELEKALSSIYCYTQAAWESSPDEFVTTPVSTGPYVLKSYVPGSQIVLERTDDYWQTDPSLIYNCWANVKTIYFDVVNETSQLAIGLETGTLDVATSLSNVDIENLKNSDGIQLQAYMGLNAYQLYFNLWSENAYNDENLRKAIMYAINTDELVAGLEVTAERMHSYLPSDLVDAPAAWKDQDYFEYDLDLAKEYLDKSGYDGGALKLIITNGTANEGAALIIKNMLAKIGVEVEINNLDATMFKKLSQLTNDWDLMIDARSGGGYAWMQYQNTFYRPNAGTDRNGLNFANLDDVEFDALHEKMRENTGDETYLEMSQYIDEHAYAYGLFRVATWVACKESIDFFTNADHTALIAGSSLYSGSILNK